MSLTERRKAILISSTSLRLHLMFSSHHLQAKLEVELEAIQTTQEGESEDELLSIDLKYIPINYKLNLNFIICITEINS